MFIQLFKSYMSKKHNNTKSSTPHGDMHTPCTHTHRHNTHTLTDTTHTHTHRHKFVLLEAFMFNVLGY